MPFFGGAGGFALVFAGGGSPTPPEVIDPADTNLVRIDSHCEDAKTKLLYRYNRKPRLEAFLCTLGDQATQVELALWDLYTKRTLATAEGAQLDGIGRIVGEPRKGRTDEVYRVFLRVRILVNRSDGRIGDLYSILLQAFGQGAEVAILEHYPAAIQVILLDDIGDVAPSDFALYLRQAKAGGVRLDFVYTVEPLADTLIWNSSEPGQVWGSTTDPAIGGVWAGVAT